MGQSYTDFSREELIAALEQAHLDAELIAARRAGDLLAKVSHELNTPLQSLYTLLYLVRISEHDEQLRYLTLAEQELERISGIIKKGATAG